MRKLVINKLYPRKDSEARNLLKGHIILKDGVKERDFWQALERDLLRQFSEEEAMPILRNTHLVACLLREPVEHRKKSSYNKVVKNGLRSKS